MRYHIYSPLYMAFLYFVNGDSYQDAQWFGLCFTTLETTPDPFGEFEPTYAD